MRRCDMVNVMENTNKAVENAVVVPKLNFRTENGGVSNKTRNAVKAQASTAVGNVLDMGNMRFEYVESKKCFVAHVADDAKTGEPVYVVLDLAVTDMHPENRAARKSRAGASKGKAKSTEVVPNLFG